MVISPEGMVQPMESLNLDLAEGLKVDFEYNSQATVQNAASNYSSGSKLGIPGATWARTKSSR